VIVKTDQPYDYVLEKITKTGKKVCTPYCGMYA